MSDRYYSAEVTEAIARERDKLLAERERLSEHNNTLKLALSEALDEIESMTDERLMSKSRIAQHRIWMEWMRAALQEAGR